MDREATWAQVGPKTLGSQQGSAWGKVGWAGQRVGASSDSGTSGQER